MSDVQYPSSYPGLNHTNSQYRGLEVKHLGSFTVAVVDTAAENTISEEERVRQARLAVAIEIDKLLGGNGDFKRTIEKEIMDRAKRFRYDPEEEADTEEDEEEMGVIVPTKDGQVVKIDLADYEDMVQSNEETALTRHYDLKGVDIVRMRDWYNNQDQADYDEEGYEQAVLNCTRETSEGTVLEIRRLPKYVKGALASEMEKTLESLVEHAEQGGAFATANGFTDAPVRVGVSSNQTCCGRKKAWVWLAIAAAVVVLVAMCS